MRATIFMLLMGMMLIILAGCGDNTKPSLGINSGQGSVSFSVKWPEMERNTGSRVIPTGTTKITVSVKQNGVTVGSATITRPASTGTINTIPVGMATVEANACNVNNIVLANGNTMVTIVKNTTSNAYLTLIANAISGDTGTLGTSSIDNASMVWVPGGTFIRGSLYGGTSGEEIQQVTLSGYWIYKYEVTIAQYRTFCTATGHPLPLIFPNGYSWDDKSGWDDSTLQQHPIVRVSWDDAKSYANWAGVTLPTEAQWEYASSGPNKNNYPWGGIATADDNDNGWDGTKCVNYWNSKLQNKSTWPVGSFPSGASWCGVQDLAGNVSEWCNDWYTQHYPSSEEINPTGPIIGSDKVKRGGDWQSYDGTAIKSYRASCRVFGSYPAISGMDSLGFRCVSNTPGP